MLDEGHIESINHGQANDSLDPAFAQFRDQTRFWVQRVAVPLIMVVGLFGNLVTVIIMTRRRMRSTTNMYLAALAFVDMLYLVLTFLLGLSHYPNMAGRKYYIYWRLRPFLMMLTDACSNTSVWLTVTFTIERFIAVKYPMKGKVWCTEARAKRLILCVFLFAILFALPVPFEWKVIEKPLSTTVKPAAATTTANSISIKQQSHNEGPEVSSATDFSIQTSSSSSSRTSDQSNATREIASAEGDELEISQIENAHIMSLEYSDFGRNETYKTIYYWSTAVIFYFIPLLSLTFFNGFLIRSVHRSLRERNKMTNQRSIISRPEPKRSLASEQRLAIGSRCGHKPVEHNLSRSTSDTRGGNEDKCLCTSTTVLSQSESVQNLSPSRQVGLSVGVTDKNARQLSSSSDIREASISEEHQKGPIKVCHFESRPANSTNRYSHDTTINLAGADSDLNKMISTMKTPDSSNNNNSNNKKVCYSNQIQSNDCSIKNENTIREIGGRQVDFRFADKPNGSQNVRNTNCDNSDGRRPDEQLERGAKSDLCASSKAAAAAPISKTQSVIMSVPFNIRATAAAPPAPLSNQSVSSNVNGSCSGGGGNNLGDKPITGLDFSRDNQVCAIQFGPDNSETRLHSNLVEVLHDDIRDARGGGGSCASGGGNGIYTNQGSSVVIAPASSQERRITIMLIAVVILFLFCQIPSAAMLLYTSVHETIPNTNEHALLLAFGNIFNFLMAVNAAGNFILYSFLSKKYRKTFVILFCNCLRSTRRGQAYLAGHLSHRSYVSSSSSGCFDDKRSRSVRFIRPAEPGATKTPPPKGANNNCIDYKANQKVADKDKRRDTLV